uniref:DNA topoisomerase n=1 Tax=Neolamprologus brichardi TaxID=32507 RepID=A0A3Q4HZB9_NEOBR
MSVLPEPRPKLHPLCVLLWSRLSFVEEQNVINGSCYNFYSSVIAVCITGGEDTRSVSAVILSSLSLEPFTSCYFFLLFRLIACVLFLLLLIFSTHFVLVQEMTHEERSLIQDLDKCNFGEIHAMHKAKTEARKNMSKEEKKVKLAFPSLLDEYGYCLLDHHKERIGNFKIEPPGLFRGRGEHPKQGMLKKRIQPEDVIINCSNFLKHKPKKHRVQHLCRCIKCYYFSLYMLMYFTCIFFQVFKSLKLFLENKQPGDELFDRLNTGVLNKHLSSLMPGLTAKVFRTYNASITLQQQLKELTNSQSRLVNRVCAECVCNDNIRFIPPPVKMVLPFTHICTSDDSFSVRLVERKKAAVKRCEEQLLKLEVQATDREENKQIALGTSKLNYLDPRISVAWCKNMEVPIEKIYNKTQREKFAWAIDMTEADFEF